MGCLPSLSRTEWVYSQSQKRPQQTGLENQTFQVLALLRMGDTDQGCGGDLTCNAVTGNNWYDHADKQI